MARLPIAIATLALVACDRSPSRGAAATAPPPPALDAPTADPDADPLAGFVAHHTLHADLGAAMKVVLAEQPRVLGIGEIHERTDRAPTAVSSLQRFMRELLPAIASQTSDLVIETWTIAPGCKTAAANTQQIERTMRRPASTGTQIGSLFGLTKANGITAHVMKLTCDDLAAVVTADGVAAEQLLALVTRELGRIAASAVRYRDEHQEIRPVVVVYGGALHNDLYPPRSTREWSYALAVDQQTGGRFVELDLFRPEQIEGNDLYAAEPWYPLVAKTGPDHVVLIERAPHSYVALLPRSE